MAQSLAEIIAGLAPVYDPQVQTIQQQQAQLPAQEAAQQAGLDTAKTNAFGDITNQANARGVLYSGTPIDAQNKYVGATYLPAVANLKANTNAEQFKLTDAINEANAQRYTQAQGILSQQQQNDEKAANDAAQLRLQQQKAAATPKAPSQAVLKQQDAATTAANLQSAAGRDGFVSPQAFAKARNDWVSAGYSSAEFNSMFKNFANLTYGPTATTNYGL